MKYEKSLEFISKKNNGKKVPNKPLEFSDKDKVFIKNVLKEEYEELELAFKKKDDIGVIDALCDIIIYCHTFACEKGINLEKMIDIVHEANMTKFENGKAIISKQNKLLKPKNFKTPEPKLKKEKERQKKEGNFFYLNNKNLEYRFTEKEISKKEKINSKKNYE